MKSCLEIGSLILLIDLIVLWVIPKKIGLQSESVFYKLIFSGLVVAFANVASLLYIKLGIKYSTTAFSILESLYFVGLAIFFYYDLLYMLVNIMPIKESEKISFPLAALPLTESIVTVLTTGSKFVIRDDKFVYTALSYNFIFVFLIVDTIIKILYLVLYFKKIDFHKRKLIIITTLIYILGYVVDYVVNVHGIFDLSIAISLILLLCYIDNPYSNLDKDYRCFKQSTIMPFLEEQFEVNKSLFVVTVGFGYLSTDSSIESELMDLRKKIIKEFSTVPEIKTFVSSDDNIYAFSDELGLLDDFLLDTQDILSDYKKEMKNSGNIRTCIVYCRNCLEIPDSQSLIRHVCIAVDNAIASSDNIKVIEITEEMIESVAKEEAVKNKVLWAIDNDRFEVFYQPIYSATLSRFTSAEALVRIRQEDGSILMPGKFIRVAEKKGLVEKIGDVVYEKVCKFIADDAPKENTIEYISVNLSSHQIQNPNLADQYIDIAKRYMIEPNTISFEISESDISSAKEIAMQNINKFKEYGFRLALDGFGKNESNLNSFVDYPVDTIKLNMRLVWEYFESTDIQSLVKAIIKIAHSLKLEVVAEGVETLPQLDIMVDEKADYIQGYYFFKPMSLNEYIDFLKPSVFGQNSIVQPTTAKKI